MIPIVNIHRRLRFKGYLSLRDWDRNEYRKNAIIGILGGAIVGNSNQGILFTSLGDLLVFLGLICGIVWIIKLLNYPNKTINISSTLTKSLEPIGIFIRNHYKLLLIIFLLIFVFYWFQLRPAEIREQCAYVKQSIPAIPALTQDEIDQVNNKYKNCIQQYPGTTVTSGHALLGTTINSPECATLASSDTETPHPAIPSKVIYVPANTETYDLCIRTHGL